MFSLIHLLLFILDQLFQVSVSVHGPFSRIQPHIKDSYTNINTVIQPKEHCYSNHCFHVGCLAKFFGKSLLIQDGSFKTFWTPGLNKWAFLGYLGKLYRIHIDMDDIGGDVNGAVFFGYLKVAAMSNFAFCFVPVAVLGYVLMEKNKERG